MTMESSTAPSRRMQGRGHRDPAKSGRPPRKAGRKRRDQQSADARRAVAISTAAGTQDGRDTVTGSSSVNEATTRTEGTAQGAGRRPKGRHKRRGEKDRGALYENTGRDAEAERMWHSRDQEAAEEASRDPNACSVCWGKCSHRDGACPCLEALPEHLVGRVIGLVEESQRHYALNLIHRFWARTPSGAPPPHVPHIADVIGHKFCYACDSTHHTAAECAELSEMDSKTFALLMAAYKYCSCNGALPEDIYADYERGSEPPDMPPCIICGEQHSFERCAAAKNVCEEPFTEITSALRAGQRQSAEEAWAANVALRNKGRAERGDNKQKSTTGALPAAQARAATATTITPSVDTAAPGTAYTREAQGQQKDVARDPPYGGIAVRTSGKPPADLCLHCLSSQHVLRECPELQSIGRDACRHLARAYMNQRYDVARQVIEKAVGCRLCHAQGHCALDCRDARGLACNEAAREHLIDVYRTGTIAEVDAALGLPNGIAGGSSKQSSQPKHAVPVAVKPFQAGPQHTLPVEVSWFQTPMDSEGTWSTSQSSTVSPSLVSAGAPPKPDWQAATARAAATGIAVPDRHQSQGGSPIPAVSEQRSAQARSQQPQGALKEYGSRKAPEPILRFAGMSLQSEGPPAVPQQPWPASGQLPGSLAPRTVLITPAAPTARRAGSSGQPSRPGPAAQEPQGQPSGLSSQHLRPLSDIQVDPPRSASLNPPTAPSAVRHPAEIGPEPPEISSVPRLPHHYMPQSEQQAQERQTGLGVLPGSQSTAQAQARLARPVYGSQGWRRDHLVPNAPASQSLSAGGAERIAQGSAFELPGQHTAALQIHAGMEQSSPQQKQAGQSTHAQQLFSAGVMPQPLQDPQPSRVPHQEFVRTQAPISASYPVAFTHPAHSAATQPALPSMAPQSAAAPAAASALHTAAQPPAPACFPESSRRERQQLMADVEAWNPAIIAPAPMQHAQAPLPINLQPLPASSAGMLPQEQHAPSGRGVGARPSSAREKPPPGFPAASQQDAVAREAAHALLRQLQGQGAPAAVSQQSASEAAPTASGSAQQAAPGAQSVATSALPAGSLFPWLSDAAASMSHGSTSSSQPPIALPQQQHRPQPRSDSGGGCEAPQPHSTSQKVSALSPLQLSDFERNLVAQWDMHSNGSASPPRQVPSWPQPPAAGPSIAMPVPVLRHTSALPAGDQPPLQQGKVGDDGTDALMAMLMNTGQVDLQQGAQHARRAQPSTPPPRQSSRSASPRPAMHPGLPPASPEPAVEAVPKSAWAKPLSSAVKAAPPGFPAQQSAPLPRKPAAAAMQRPSSAGQALPAAEETGNAALTSTGRPAAPAEASGWTKVSKAGKASAPATEVPDAQAAPSSGDNTDDKDLAAAIEASLKTARLPKSALTPKRAIALQNGVSEPAAAATEDSSAGPGLQNETGEYNCFLNVVVQCLWHCRAFRDAFLSLDRRIIQEDSVLRELMKLFRLFGQSRPGSIGKRTLDPTGLREALARLDAKRFATGEMSDAAEVLNALKERLEASEEGELMVRAVFGCTIREQLHCSSCGEDTRQHTFCQHLFNASASGMRLNALLMSHELEGRLPAAGAVLRELEKQTSIKSCSADEGGCGRRQPMQQFLEGTPPAAFALQLVWESGQESGQDIRDTLDIIREGLDLSKVYLGLVAGEHRYRPCSMVCYYGRHYHAFARMEGQWLGFDDATSSLVGPWEDLVRKCELGKIQPAVLFFEAAA